MARSDQGNSATKLILQPGSEFRDVRGGFDAGNRSFECDEHYAERIAPRVGESDVEILRRARAREGGEYRRSFAAMFATDVSERIGANGIVTFNVTFAGLKRPSVAKPAEVTEDVDSENFSAVPTGGYVLPNTYQRPLISVTRTYVTRGKKPDTFATGSESIPPGYVRNPRPQYYWTAIIPTQELVFEGWILRRRQTRSVGSGRNTLWETADTHVYEYITNQT